METAKKQTLAEMMEPELRKSFGIDKTPLIPDKDNNKKMQKASLKIVPEELNESPKPVRETKDSVEYLGVSLKKVQNTDSIYIPEREQYEDYINDEYALRLQQKIAIAFAQDEPILIEGGTSIGKTTTVKKMCAELGYEVHYVNLNGTTDVEDLMGRYIPNPHKKKPEDPEYIFADGKVTSGLRKEKGKIKVIILDEYNSAAPNIVIRLHEVLDALERDGDVVLSEDASELLSTSRSHTKVIALTNPPGKGFFGREPLDPAQLRRWVYKKEPTELPQNTFDHSSDVLFGLADRDVSPKEINYLHLPEFKISAEQLSEIPGIGEILQKYKEFHIAAKNLVKNRQIGADQPQVFTYDDRMEPRRIRDFVLRFYNGDITETFRYALQYYYVDKLESETDRQKLLELIEYVSVSFSCNSKRRGLDGNSNEVQKIQGSISEQMEKAKNIMGGNNFFGPKAVKDTFDIDVNPLLIPPIPFSKKELRKAKKQGQFLVLRVSKTNDGEPLTMQKMEMIEASGKSGMPIISNSLRWFENEDFFKKETSEVQWALVSRDVVPGTTSANYHRQAENVMEYLENTVFANTKTPDIYQKAIDEFRRKRDSSKLDKLTRHLPVEVFYDLLIRDKNTPANYKRLLSDKWTFTRGVSFNGNFVSIGPFTHNGINIANKYDAHKNHGALGVLLNRTV